MTDIRDDTRHAFSAIFGREPDGLWSAPGAITLLGSGAGASLSLAINRRTVVGLGLRDDRVIRVASVLAEEAIEVPLAELAPSTMVGWAAYPLGVAWALGQRGADLAAVPGVDILIESDVPVGMGLGSSAAVQAAVALALNDAWQLGLDRDALAQACGVADAAGPAAGASLLATSDTALVIAGGVRETVPLGFTAAGLGLVIIDTGAPSPQSSGDANEDATADPDEDARVTDALQLLREHSPGELGRVLDACHASLRAASGGLVPQHELAAEISVANGALGARPLGSGGTIVALAPLDAVSRIQVGIDGAFAEHGFGQPETFVVTSSHGAVRE